MKIGVKTEDIHEYFRTKNTLWVKDNQYPLVNINCTIGWNAHIYAPMVLTAHNWHNWKRVFLSCYCHEIYRVEAVSLKVSKFWDYVGFGSISWKIDTLLITA